MSASGGVLLAAKTRRAARGLSRQFAAREVRKRYEALVCGLLQGQGRIDRPLSGQAAVTNFEAGPGVYLHASMCMYIHIKCMHAYIHDTYPQASTPPCVYVDVHVYVYVHVHVCMHERM